MEEALRNAGIKRRNVLVTNTMCCRPPGNDLQAILRQVSKENKKRQSEFDKEKKAAELQNAEPPRPPEMVPSPLECCSPRLFNEIRGIPNRITLGKTATNLLTGGSTGILNIRGGVIELADAEVEGRTLKTMPTVHPAFALRQKRWMHVFMSDVQKAVLWFQGMADWTPPQFIWNPTAEELTEFLETSDSFAYDLETDGIEPLEAKIRCVCIARPDKGLVISLLGMDGYTRFYSPDDERRIISILIKFFRDQAKVKIGHNVLNYDSAVLKSNWGIVPVNQIDTLLIHRNVESELPHGLAFVGTMYSLAPNWKVNKDGQKLSTEAAGDRELAEYCCNDSGVNIRILSPLIVKLQERQQVHIWENDQRIQHICREMHEVGMYVDQPTRLKEERKMLALRYDVLGQIRSFVGNDDFNPGSVPQLQDLLFNRWGLDPQIDPEDKYTETAKKLELLSWEGISTGDLILRSLLFDPAVPEDKRAFIKLVRRYRKLMKLLGTYVCKLRFKGELNELGWDEDEDWDDKETRKRYGAKRTGIVDPKTGRMHPGYSSGVAVTGRLASSKPFNAQNCPPDLRKIVHAAPGHVLIGADMDQLEQRIAAARWRVQLYLRAFAEGKDPHSMTAFAVFGEAFCRAAGVDPKQFGPEWHSHFVGQAYDEAGGFDKERASSEAKELRDLSKTVAYASQYMGSDETVHKVIQKTEVPARGRDGKPLADGTTDLPYAKQELRKTRRMRKAWLQAAPEYEAGWQAEIDLFNQQGFLTEPVMGRRRDFLDGIDKDANAVVNFPIQSSGASIVSKIMLDLHAEVPFEKWGPGTGIINQCHDSIVIECPADGVVFDEKGKPQGPKDALPFRVAALMNEVMNREEVSLPGVRFTATAKVGRTWKDV